MVWEVTDVSCTAHVWNVAYANDVNTRATESGASRRIRDYS
jgi:hypothetical protein